MQRLDSIQSFRAEEASAEALYLGEGASLRSIRARTQNNPAYKRKLAGALKFIEEIQTDRRPLYELREMLSGERYLQCFNETLSTSDFSYLFGDVIDRQLLAQYASAQPSWQSWCRRATVPDFRTVKRFVLDGMRSALPLVEQDTNYNASKVVDNAYSYAVQKYGRTIPLAWETIINDDLNAFSRIPNLMAESAIYTEEDFATRLICNSSGFLTAVFSTTYKNTITTAHGAASNHPAFSVQGLQDAITVLMSQKDSDGNPIIVRGITVVGPPQMAVIAQSIIGQVKQLRIGPGGSTTANEKLVYTDVPDWLKSLKFEVGYFLPLVNTTAGTTTWYVFADPNIGRPAVELGFLRGHEQPEIFRKLPTAMRLGGAVDPLDGSYENDSVGYKIRHVIGGVIEDPKSVVVSRGDAQA